MFLDSSRRESSYMRQKLLYPPRLARLLACTSTLILALGLGACQTSGLSDITGSIDERADTGRASDPRRDVELYQERYRANPQPVRLLAIRKARTRSEVPIPTEVPTPV